MGRSITMGAEILKAIGTKEKAKTKVDIIESYQVRVSKRE